LLSGLSEFIFVLLFSSDLVNAQIYMHGVDSNQEFSSGIMFLSARKSETEVYTDGKLPLVFS